MSRRKRLAIVDFSEVFHYSESEYGISWNKCNDLFFDTIFQNKGHTECSQEVLLSFMSEYEEYDAPAFTQATKILLEFMKRERLKECMVVYS